MAMNISEFDDVFNRLVVEELTKHGFSSHGKSLYFMDDMHTVSMIRLGGRMTKAGSISYLICCRHSFLPNLNEEVPTKFESSVHAYPLKLQPSLIKRNLSNLNINYVQNHSNFGYEVFTYAAKSNDEIETYLKELAILIIAVKAWFIEQPVSTLANQIRKFFNKAWIEKIWLEAYEKNDAI